MRTVVVGPLPAEIEQYLARRRAVGADLYDEVWEGEYHMVPAPRANHSILDVEIAVALRPHARRTGFVGLGPFNLGVVDDYRVPDQGLLREATAEAFLPTAALVVEILSPGDESRAKLPFYAAHHVDEVVTVDPQARTVTWLARRGAAYVEVEQSDLLEVAVVDVVSVIAWPPRP